MSDQALDAATQQAMKDIFEAGRQAGIRDGYMQALRELQLHIQDRLDPSAIIAQPQPTTPLNEVELSVRAHNLLYRKGIRTVESSSNELRLNSWKCLRWATDYWMRSGRSWPHLAMSYGRAE